MRRGGKRGGSGGDRRYEQKEGKKWSMKKTPEVEEGEMAEPLLAVSRFSEKHASLPLPMRGAGQGAGRQEWTSEGVWEDLK